jgi:hypothetical protein
MFTCCREATKIGCGGAEMKGLERWAEEPLEDRSGLIAMAERLRKQWFTGKRRMIPCRVNAHIPLIIYPIFIHEKEATNEAYKLGSHAALSGEKDSVVPIDSVTPLQGRLPQV